MIDTWQEVRLDEVAEIIISNVDKKSKPGEKSVQLCNYLDVYNNNAVHTNMPFMTATATDMQIQKFGLRVGDVVITKDSETPDDIAVSTFVESAAENLVCGYHLAIIRTNQYVDGHFLKYCFDLPQVQHYFGSRANGATRFGLTKQSIEHAIFKLPKLNEQRRIVEILKTWDEEIEEIDVLRVAWISQKQGLMQVLLTGKCRFTESKNQPWQTLPLGDCATLNKKMVAPPNFGEMPYVGLEHIDERGLLLNGDASKVSSEKTLFKRGDILFGKLRPYLRKVAHASFDGICSTDIWVVQQKKNVDQRFLFYCMASTPLINRAISSSEGTRMPRAKWDYLSRYKLTIPSLPEQHKISAVLQTWDMAIEKLDALRAAKINQKRGLMQKLLTEKIRVKT